MVDSTINDTSITATYSWQCNTGCFADGMTTPAISRYLTDMDSGMINCSVTIDGDEYMSDVMFDLQVTQGTKACIIIYVHTTYIHSDYLYACTKHENSLTSVQIRANLI